MSIPFQGTQTFLFSPLSLSNCTLWLDASDFTTLFQNTAGTTAVTGSGQSVALWKDKSTSSNNASNATNPPSILTASQNNKSVLNFGGAQYLNLDVAKMPTGSATYSFFILTKTSSSGVGVFLSWGATSAFGKAPQFYFNGYNLANDLYGSNGPSDTTSYNNSYVLNSAILTPSVYSGWDNGTSFSTTDVPVANLNIGNTFAYIGVGQVSGSLYTPFYFNGQIAEIIGYNRQLNSTERQQIEAYMLWKWGLQANLPAGNPNKQSPVYALQPFPLVPQVAYGTNSLVFNPLSITGCQLWFDAADTSSFSLSGSNILQWNDKSLNKYAVYQTSAGSQPTISYNSQNGLNGVQFTTASFLSNLATNMSNFTTGSATSVFLAARNASANTGWNIINTIWFIAGGGGGTQRYHFSFNRVATAGTTLFANSNLVGQVTSNATSPNSNAILGFTASATSVTIHTNGSTDTYSGVSLPNASGNTLFLLGENRNNSGVGSNIQIFEMLGYNVQVSDSQRQQIEGYLAWKWGLTSLMPTTNPYIASPLAPFRFSVRQTAQASSWTPLNILGSVLWLDAKSPSSITPSTGGTVTAVTDKSASPKTISVTNTVSYTQNTALVFTDSAGRLSPALMPSAPYDYIFVGTANSSSATWRTMLRTGSGTGTHPFLLQSGTDNAGMWDGTAFYQFGSLTQATNEKAMFYGSMATNRTITASKNGTVTLTTASPAGNESILTTVGNNSAGLQPYGQLHEIVIYSKTLTLSERQQLEGYLAWKWGLQGSLPINHPFKFFPPSPS